MDRTQASYTASSTVRYGALLFVLAAMFASCSGGGGSSSTPATGSGSGSGAGSGSSSGTGGTGGTGGSGSSGGTKASAVDVLTYHNDIARTGQYLVETTLTPANVNSTQFGKVGFLFVDGKVDAQPLYAGNVTIKGAAHNVVYVATEHDSVYAFDADTNTELWHHSLIPSGETTSDDRNCLQVTPEIGITSTPVIDRSRGANGTLYTVTMTKDTTGAYH